MNEKIKAIIKGFEDDASAARIKEEHRIFHVTATMKQRTECSPQFFAEIRILQQRADLMLKKGVIDDSTFALIENRIRTNIYYTEESCRFDNYGIEDYETQNRKYNETVEGNNIYESFKQESIIEGRTSDTQKQIHSPKKIGIRSWLKNLIYGEPKKINAL